MINDVYLPLVGYSSLNHVSITLVFMCVCLCVPVVESNFISCMTCMIT